MTDTDILKSLAEHQPQVRELIQAPAPEQQQRGYFHTLREICQQPSTWLATCELILGSSAVLTRSLAGIKTLILTGSGSSEYAGACARLVLQNELGVPAEAIGGGTLLTYGGHAMPPLRPGLVVSLARSGDSPESVGTLSLLLESEPQLRHLILTCNANGALAANYRDNPRVDVLALDERTNDRSLVMTSSFTNLVLAAYSLAHLENPASYRALCAKLSRIAATMLQTSFAIFADLAERNFQRVVFLANGSRFGAAREAALKMLEMTAGRVSTICETYLGLRHGPMSFVGDDSLIVCFLSSDARRRAYEADLLRELDRKGLGMAKLVVGDRVPPDLIRNQDSVLECEGLADVGDENAAVVDVVAAQLLAFFRCLKEGLRPDSPSESGVIQRVVESFTLHNYPWGQDGT